MSRPVVAVLGAGAWGRNHVRVLASMRGARLAWVADPDPDALEAAAPVAGRASLTRDVDAPLADEAVDAVVVATPTPTHAPLVRAALTAGKHVLVEKPMAESAEAAWDLVRRARRADRQLVIGHLLLHHPAVRRLKRLLDEGRLGHLHYLHAQRTNLGRIRTDESALHSLAPHDISVMVRLLGRWPTAVAAQGAACVQPRWEDVVFLTLRFPGDVLGHVHLSWLDPQKARRLCLVGSRRMAVFDDMDPDAWLRLHDKAAGEAPPPDDESGAWPVHAGGEQVIEVARREPLREELLAFLRTVRTGKPGPAIAEDGARVVRVLEAADRSLRQRGREVALRIR